MRANGRAADELRPVFLETGLNKLKPGGGTALYDAVYRACRDQMLRGIPENAEVRKALILVSDGDALCADGTL